ncbi:MAG: ChbG/HpnK family deacetylase [Ignavibacteria bacterium]|nr:ChbG/HpnK family deacetylase [Ignavibacteria bacterium]MCU7517028.1 ChbG/HpnK family deacetylase [Ignavibacteria bacterium]
MRQTINPFLIMMGFLVLLIVLVFLRNNYYHKGSSSPVVLLRCDDFGISRSVNLAIEKLAERKIPFSASLIVNARFYNEAVEILKKNRTISVGVHLTFTSEWENDRWKPLLPIEKVRSLVDSNGCFYPSRSSLWKQRPDTLEIEEEAEAQIKKVLKSGIKISYIDAHMFSLYSKEYHNILKRLGAKYNLLVSGMNNELLLNDMFKTDAGNKLNKYLEILSNVDSGDTCLIVLHLAAYPDELNSMKDLNNPYFTQNGSYRYSEYCAVISDKAMQFIDKKKIKLINYSNYSIKMPK